MKQKMLGKNLNGYRHPAKISVYAEIHRSRFGIEILLNCKFSERIHRKYVYTVNTFTGYTNLDIKIVPTIDDS